MADMIKLMNYRYFYFLWVLILSVAVFLRLYQLGQIPVSLYWDEVAMLVDAQSVAATLMDMHSRAWFQLIYPSYGDYKLPVYIYATVFSEAVFGLNSFAVRLPSILAGIATIFFTYLLVVDFKYPRLEPNVVSI